MTASGRVDALIAADETLEMLGIDQSSVIDPFAAIDRLGLALHITKLDNLLGAVVPEGNGGVLITSQRGPAIQRYTAAHEIGHWILHSEQLQVDGEEEVLGRPSTEIEREAQLFAGYFLMPPTLLNRALAAHELESGHIEPEHVYRLSRDLDVSYEAASRRLLAGRLINRNQFQQIADFGRMAALRRASGGHRPANGLADVWDATSADDVVNLVVEEHDEVLVDLVEQRTTGWRWQTSEELAQRNGGSPVPHPRPVPPAATATPLRQRPDQVSQPDPDHLLAAVRPVNQLEVAIADLDDEAPTARVVDDRYLAGDEAESVTQRRRRRAARARFGGSSGLISALALADDPMIGGNGVRTVVVRAATPGSWRLQLFYAQAYDPDDEPLLSYELQLTVQPTPNTAFRRRQLQGDLDRRLPGDPADNAEFGVDQG